MVVFRICRQELLVSPLRQEGDGISFSQMIICLSLRRW